MVSVIIPTYNSAKYIRDAIDSVLQQTYSEFEILVIDDGSTDDTKTIVTENYPQVTYYPVPHKGVSTARNYGITNAKGEYVAFLDADDKWLPQKLELQLACFKINNSLGMVFTENFSFDENGIINTKFYKRERLMCGDIVKNIFLKSYVGTSTVMVKKAVFSTVGLFKTNLTIGEDDNLWMRIALRYPVELVDESLMSYRKSAGSLTRKSGCFFKEVYKSIRTIQKDFPDLSTRLGKRVFRLKYASIFFSEGYSYFSQDKYAKANKYFLRSYLNNPYKGRCFFLFVLTLFPSLFINKLFEIKRILKF